MRHIRSFISAILLFICLFYVSGQDLLNSNRTSYYTYIYQLTDIETKDLFKNKKWEFSKSLLHTLTDSFPTHLSYDKDLPPGHYFYFYTREGNQVFEYFSISKFDVVVFNNETDINIQVLSLHGEIISDAIVKTGNKRIRFNPKTNSYSHEKSNRKGLITVYWNNHTEYYELNRFINNSWIKRTSRTIAYNTPAKYIWKPVRFIAFLPIDGTKSIINNYPTGTIRQTSHFFSNAYSSIACNIFNDIWHCRYNRRVGYAGYFVFNKPKYLPGDTVKLKAFITKENGRPINKPLDLYLNVPGKRIKMAELHPYRRGAYHHNFFIHDSLDLKLDRRYHMALISSKGETKMNGWFTYEDYELSKLKVDLRADTDVFYNNKEQTIYIKGTDENNLNILDGRLNILVSPAKVNELISNHAFIPDTLLYKSLPLNPSKETTITIPDTIFPKVNMDYNVHVELLTTDNESASTSKTYKYYHTKNDFEINLENDSIAFDFKSDGIPINIDASIYGLDHFGNQTLIKQSKTPLKTELNPFYNEYIATSENKTAKAINISNESSLIQTYSSRTKDDVSIAVYNPRNIEFNYFIYRGNRRIESGSTRSLDISRKARTKKNYFFSISYIWGGKVYTENYKIPIEERRLNVEVIKPQLVYPGQEVEVEIRVTDYSSSPVKDVDLTAYALTSKFEYLPPQLPSFEKNRKNRTFINRFTINHAESKHPELILDYELWKLLSGIDSIEYYKFLFPGNNIYQSEYTPKEEITQFAPFIVSDKGKLKPIHIIYVNARPVYFSWSNHSQPYSFKIQPGYNQITLRTDDKTITIDSLFFETGKKQIISINENIQHHNIRVQSSNNKFSNQETTALANLMFPYRNNFHSNIAYIQTSSGIQMLNRLNSQPIRYNYTGPVSSYFSFNQLNRYSMKLEHEPGFQYDFSPNLVKMRSYNSKHLIPGKLSGKHLPQSFSDAVITEKSILAEWQKEQYRLKRLRARNFVPESQSSGNGRIQLSIEQNEENQSQRQLLNTIVKKHDDPLFLHIYHNRTFIENLDKGIYLVILFFENSEYHIIDSIGVKNNGLNFYQIKLPKALKKDSFSNNIAELIEDHLYAPVHTLNHEKKIISEFSSTYFQAFPTVGGNTIQGFVYDNDSGEPIPGVTIMVKGTNLGVVTNLEGFYSITVPPHYTFLTYNFIGYNQEVISTDAGDRIDVFLTSDYVSLEEVIVVGYGVSRRQSLTQSASSISTNNQLNISHQLAGQTPGIQILGNLSTGDQEGKPLIIVNGLVFTGDISSLNPGLINSTEILKGDAATSIYGLKAVNGVIIISTKDSFIANQTPHNLREGHFDETFTELAMQSGSIRQNFSDYAFWKPTLSTDKNGVATFTTTFPDDITSWETFVLAMNSRKQSGQTKSITRSFKPLMGQLAVPRFLVETDTTNIIGKALNYLPDSIKLTTTFKINEIENLRLDDRYCQEILIDTLQITTHDQDSLKIEYSLKTESNYFDGELRHIPIYPIGMEETLGFFHVLNNDTVITIQFNPEIDSAYIYAHSDVLNILQSEAHQVINYRYNCNEQIASRIKALLMIKKIAKLNNEEFKLEKQLLNQIDLLEKGINRNGLWGWWRNSEPEYWISLHVVEALTAAQHAGYKININTQTLSQRFILELDRTNNFTYQIRILKAIKTLEPHINLTHEIEKLSLPKEFNLNHLLLLKELKMSNDIPVEIDFLDAFKNQTILGNIYYNDTIKNLYRYNILNNRVQSTLLAYRIIKSSNEPDQDLLLQIRNYLLERRGSGKWRNTYESIKILETIVPDILGEKGRVSAPKLILRGNIDKTVDEFPFEHKISNNSDLTIEKSGSFPVYFTSYQKFWNKEPTRNTTNFKIDTWFSNTTNNILTAGVETSLIVNLIVKADAEYVMLNIPIPGGCSYGERIQGGWPEVHREYFRNETAVFFRTLKQGEYTLEVKLVPRFTGRYNLNPAKIELMYFPTFNGNNEIKPIIIKD
ncbi:carboxypeptidase-like regulatory domain-containing protein [Natronoflexus pectinivorans]|uniref:TonB-dependent SusC/RagA subfamily outer membrane receptor n=1 Tax=Natronoflexus pectinivorans TaxID=682526 RepID=A0A4R2GH32_9BACT|nr:alpha-2-macroglobulin family protein [Natronoflexus pectinivorans]TCO07688.1 TonB-dependent SusC/RagA subfamily outer membrane receptor [Natronoflexus pectinivorans]